MAQECGVSLFFRAHVSAPAFWGWLSRRRGRGRGRGRKRRLVVVLGPLSFASHTSGSRCFGVFGCLGCISQQDSEVLLQCRKTLGCDTSDLSLLCELCLELAHALLHPLWTCVCACPTKDLWAKTIDVHQREVVRYGVCEQGERFCLLLIPGREMMSASRASVWTSGEGGMVRGFTYSRSHCASSFERGTLLACARATATSGSSISWRLA